MSDVDVEALKGQAGPSSGIEKKFPKAAAGNGP
jgi:hypothetical protein